MAEAAFPYREVAEKMRTQTPPPTMDMSVRGYYASTAIYSVIYALDQLAAEQQEN